MAYIGCDKNESSQSWAGDDNGMEVHSAALKLCLGCSNFSSGVDVPFMEVELLVQGVHGSNK